jgi:hypothetical protein
MVRLTFASAIFPTTRTDASYVFHEDCTAVRLRPRHSRQILNYSLRALVRANLRSPLKMIIKYINEREDFREFFIRDDYSTSPLSYDAFDNAHLMYREPLLVPHATQMYREHVLVCTSIINHVIQEVFIAFN